MIILTDKLIDAKADLCWNHQQEQLQGKVKIDCICGQLADMIYLTRQEVAQEIERELCNNGRSCYGVNQEHCDTVRELAAIARGNKMPVPEGVITTSETLYNLNPKEEKKDDKPLPSNGEGESGLQVGSVG